MADETTRQRAEDALAKQVVADVSPAELPLFAATAARYHADPKGTLETRTSSDETLGFGVETAVVLLAPFALDLVKRLFTRLVDKLGDGAVDSLADRITAHFSSGPAAHKHEKHDGSQAQHDGPPPLTAEQLAVVAETAREEARQLALPPDQAEALADGVVAALATRT